MKNLLARLSVAAILLALFVPAGFAADSTVTNLPAASALDGSELLLGVQGGASKKITGSQLKALSVSGTPTAGNVAIGKSGALLGDSLSYGTNGGISMSGGGTPAYNNCFWNDVDTCTTENIRLRERLAIGNAVSLTDNRTGNSVWNSTWFGTLPSAQQGSNYLARDAQLSVMTDRGSIGISGMALSSQGDALGSLKPVPIGVAGYVYNDTAVAGHNSWAGYYEGIHAPNGVNSFTFGLEIETRNTSATNTVSNPYSVGQGDIGLWVGAGAGVGSGTGAPNPSNAALVTINNQQTFNTGIIFKDGSLTKDGSNNSVAIAMGQGAAFQWSVSNGVTGAVIRSNVTTSGKDMSILFADNQTQLTGASGAALVNINASPSLSLPTIAFPTCGTNCGFLAPGANQWELVVGGAKVIDYGVTAGGIFSISKTLAMGSQSITGVNNLLGNLSGSYQLVNAAASATVPTLIPNQTSTGTGFGAQASGNISAIVANTEVARFVAGGLILPTAATGTPTASLCLDASNNVIKKTTSGSCI